MSSLFREDPHRRSVSPVIGKMNSQRPESGSDGTPRARCLYPVPEVAAQLGDVSERYVWSLIDQGRLRTVKLGRRRLVPHDALAEFLASLNVPCPEPGERATAASPAA
jgi:excisionase family DNA binding protein